MRSRERGEGEKGRRGEGQKGRRGQGAGRERKGMTSLVDQTVVPDEKRLSDQRFGMGHLATARREVDSYHNEWIPRFLRGFMIGTCFPWLKAKHSYVAVHGEKYRRIAPTVPLPIAEPYEERERKIGERKMKR